MANFNSDKKYGGSKGGNKFGGRDSGPRSYFGNKDSGKPTMHRATCDECGKSCEVPFKPMGSKPVYCSDCFKSMNMGSERSESRDSGKSFGNNKSYSQGKSFGSSKNYSEGKSYSSNNSFKPAFNKGPDQSKQQFEILNVKLDKIMKMLSSALNADRVQSPETIQVAEGAPSEPMMESVVKIEASEKPKPKKRAKKE